MNARASAILDAVSRATNKLILDEPFYGHFFVGMVKEVSLRVKTMAVGPSGSQVKLFVNPDFWETRLTNESMRVGLIKHELLHVVLKHIFRAKAYKHKDLFNIACDLVVNQYILESQLPPDRLHIGLFPDLGLKPEMDADYYYHRLLPPYERVREREKDSLDQTDLSEKTIRELLNESDEWQDRHGMWEDLEEMPNAMQEVVEQNVTESVRQALEKAMHDKRWSNLPDGLRRSLEEAAIKKEASVNWRRILRMFTESSSKTFIQNTIRRPSKRFGTTPGIRIRRRQNFVVVLDTSGSISQEELSLFSNEIYHIWKRGSTVTMIEADAKVHAAYPFNGKLPMKVKGGGGTDFGPALRHANLLPRVDALIYFTDGHAETPAVATRYPVLWMICKEGISAESERWKALPGRKVKMTG